MNESDRFSMETVYATSRFSIEALTKRSKPMIIVDKENEGRETQKY